MSDDAFNPFRARHRFGEDAGFIPGTILPQGYGRPGDPVGTRTAAYGAAGSADSHGGKSQVTMPQKYGWANFLSFSIVGAAVSVRLLAQPTDTRVFLVVQNFDTVADLWINFGQGAAVNLGLKVAPGGSFFSDAFVPQNDLFGFSASSIACGVMFSNLGF